MAEVSSHFSRGSVAMVFDQLGRLCRRRNSCDACRSSSLLAK